MKKVVKKMKKEKVARGRIVDPRGLVMGLVHPLVGWFVRYAFSPKPATTTATTAVAVADVSALCPQRSFIHSYDPSSPVHVPSIMSA